MVVIRWSFRLTDDREIEQLTKRVKELEAQVQTQTRRPQNLAGQKESIYVLGDLKTPLDPFQGHGKPRVRWEGVYTRSAKLDQTQYYGPSSSFYFIARVSSYLGSVFGQPTSDDYMQPKSASMSFASPASAQPDRASALRESGLAIEDLPEEPAGDCLTEIQEEYFLNLYWQSYHCTYQILDEAEFRQHYRSLWTGSGPRKPSALVDIVLALCMQYGVSSLSRGEADAFRADVDSTDATIAGRALYRRSQALLKNELESPSIFTLQCHVLTAVYLCNASFQNMAHSLLALAVRTAQILGLHFEPPEHLPRQQRELRKRLWWTLYAVETKTCMKLGRPWSVQMEDISCSLPGDDRELAFLSGSHFASIGETTWLTYGVHVGKLIMSARAIHVAFYERCADVLTETGGKSLYTDLASLETCADHLLLCLACMQTWLDGVPDALKTKRKTGTVSFATDNVSLEIERFAPAWLQQQRILLELLYHNLYTNLCRPCIYFPTSRATVTPKADELATKSVNHAMALTYIMDQMLMETKLLNGWQEAFQWQWNAALSMVGFVLAYPSCRTVSTVRAAIDTAITVFDTMGKRFAVAASAANVTRDVTAKADFLIHRAQSSATPPLEITTVFDGAQSAPPVPGIDTTDIPPGLDDSMGLAFTMDSFTSFEPMYAGNLFDMWTAPEINFNGL